MGESSSIGAILALLLLSVIFKGFQAERVVLSVNVKKPIVLTSERFLSITLDPSVVFTGNLLKNDSEKNLNMAKALAPAFLRVAGPKSNSYTFQRDDAVIPKDPSGFVLTEGNWSMLNQWAENAGLSILAAVAPQEHSKGISDSQDGIWDSRNVLDLISFSDRKGFNVSWQIGYECLTRCELSGEELGKNVIRLRNILDAFPRYSKSTIAGPDIVTFKTIQEQSYLHDYLNTAANAFSVITWHPEFPSITLDSNNSVLVHHDNLASDKDLLHRIVSHSNVKKPLWLVESKPEMCKHQFLGALIWARRLGNSAKLNAQVLMRELHSNFFKPTPDFWVSVLHKTLVGRKVFDAKIITENPAHIHFYCQCTKPSSKYNSGSLTIFGINMAPSKTVVTLKGIKIKTLHKYILLPGFDADNRMFSEVVLLNNKTLKLRNGKYMPELEPTIVTNGEKGNPMVLPSGGIGFWVIPDIKIKACEDRKSANAHKIVLEKFTNSFEEAASEEDTAIEQINDDIIEETTGNRKLLRNMIKEFHAKKDMERLAKLLKRRENLDEKKNKYSHIDLHENIDSINNNNNNNTNNNNETESAEEIITTLEKYKKRVSELESRIKNSLRHKDFEDDYFDNDKLNKAIDLIKKIEITLTDSNEIEESSQKSVDSESNFLNELLKSRKIKRASLSDVVERNLLTIYNLLADEQLKRQRFKTKIGDHGAIFSRKRRAIDKKYHDGYAPISSTIKKLNKNAEKKQLLGRVNKDNINNKRLSKLTLSRRKNRKLKSQEDNFYGFERLPPLENFPTGDVHVDLESSFKNDFLDVNVQEQVSADKDEFSFGVPTKISNNTVKSIENKDELGKFSDSYSKLYNIQVPDIKNNFKNNYADEIMNQEPKKMEEIFDFDNFNPNFPQEENLEFLKIFNNNDGFVSGSDYLESDGEIKTGNPRQKRNLQDLDEILNNEMIFEDDNNLKDCECRSTRKVADIQKNLESMSRKKRDTSAVKLNAENFNDSLTVKEVHGKNSSIDLKIKEKVLKNSKQLIKPVGMKKDFEEPLEILPKLYGDDDSSEVSKIKHVRQAIPSRTIVKRTLKSSVTQASPIQKRKCRLSTTETPTTVSTSTKSKKNIKSKNPQTVEKHGKLSAKHSSTDHEGKNIATSIVSLHKKNHKLSGNKKNSSTISSTLESAISKIKKSRHAKHDQKQDSSALKQKLHECVEHAFDTKKKKIVKRSIALPIQGENNIVDDLHSAASSSRKKELNYFRGSVKNNENDLKKKSDINVLKLNDFNEEEIKYKRPKYKRLMMKQNNMKEKKNFKYNREKRDAGKNEELTDDDSEILTNQIAMENKKKKDEINDFILDNKILKNQQIMKDNGFLSFIETVPTTIDTFSTETVKNLIQSDEKLIETDKETTENNVEAIVQKNENNLNEISIVDYFIDVFQILSDFFNSTIHIFVV